MEEWERHYRALQQRVLRPDPPNAWRDLWGWLVADRWLYWRFRLALRCKVRSS
jgi:hypothetical protein